jgi:hypothetical protein
MLRNRPTFFSAAKLRCVVQLNSLLDLLLQDRCHVEVRIMQTFCTPKLRVVYKRDKTVKIIQGS